jgi:N6-adenosine-specific RNA methylase IME4
MTLFAPLPTVPGGFRCVTIDAPLYFGTRSAKGQGRSPSQHYNDHTAAEIMTPPVREIVARDAWLFLWWPDPHILMLSDMLDAFGFELSGRGFTWIKTLKSLARGSRLISTDEIESVLRMNNGFTTRKNSETVWLARRGNPQILSHGVREIIVSPLREHSRKPDEFYHRVERLCPGPRVDLFGRQSREGWTVFGNESGRFDPPALLNLPTLEVVS